MQSINNLYLQNSPSVQTVPLQTSNEGMAPIRVLSFSDLVDAVNPLQHIPLASSAYRSISGTSISAASQLAGDTLYGVASGGGILSVASSAADFAVKQVTGKDIGGNVISAISSSDNTSTSKEFKLVASDSVQPIEDTPKSEIVSTIDNKIQHLEFADAKYRSVQALDSVKQKLLKTIA